MLLLSITHFPPRGKHYPDFCKNHPFVLISSLVTVTLSLNNIIFSLDLLETSDRWNETLHVVLQLAS